MYDRLLSADRHRSFFLFGPRGTGKSSWTQRHFADAVIIDLLESELFLDLLVHPGHLEKLASGARSGWIVIDEIQKVPALLDEVHRLIERRRLKFLLA